MALGDLFGDIVELARMGSSAQLAQLLNTGAQAGLPLPLLSRLEVVAMGGGGISSMHPGLTSLQIPLPPTPPTTTAVLAAVVATTEQGSSSVLDRVAVQLERDSYEWVDTEEGVRMLMRQLKEWANAYGGPSDQAEMTRPVMLCGIDTGTAGPSRSPLSLFVEHPPPCLRRHR